MVVRGGYGVFFDQIWTNDTGNVVQNYPNVFTQQLANDARVTGIPTPSSRARRRPRS